MSVDTDILLRVRDRATLRAALEAYAVADREAWSDQGRGAEYEGLLAEGYDPTPPLRVHADGSVSIFTGLSFHDPDVDFSIRCWLHVYLGERLAKVHDDPRGVFITPDGSEARATTYEGIVEELTGLGRFVDPSPPTAAEHRVARMQTMHAAEDSNHLALLGDALLGAPTETGEARGRQAARVARMSARLTARRP